MSFDFAKEISMKDLVFDFDIDSKVATQQFFNNYFNIINISANFCGYEFEFDLFSSILTNSNLSQIKSDDVEFVDFINWYQEEGFDILVSVYYNAMSICDEVVDLKTIFDYVMIKFKKGLKDKDFYLIYDALLSSIYVIEKEI